MLALTHSLIARVQLLNTESISAQQHLLAIGWWETELGCRFLGEALYKEGATTETDLLHLIISFIFLVMITLQSFKYSCSVGHVRSHVLPYKTNASKKKRVEAQEHWVASKSNSAGRILLSFQF